MVLAYRDMSFCSSNCVNAECDRFLSDDVRAKARERGLGISVMNFSGTCPHYISGEDPK